MAYRYIKSILMFVVLLLTVQASQALICKTCYFSKPYSKVAFQALQDYSMRASELIKQHKFKPENLTVAQLQLVSADPKLHELNKITAKAYLNGANLSNLVLVGVDLSEASLNGVNIDKSNLKGANFSKAHMMEVIFDGANCENSNFEGTNLTGSRLASVRLTDANLKGAKLGGVNLSHTFMRGADLSNAHLLFANFEQANLTNVNFSKSEMVLANFKGAVLKGANLEGANLTKANFYAADLTNVTLKDANITETIFVKTIMYRKKGKKQISLNELTAQKVNPIGMNSAVITPEELQTRFHDGLISFTAYIKQSSFPEPKKPFSADQLKSFEEEAKNIKMLATSTLKQMHDYMNKSGSYIIMRDIYFGFQLDSSRQKWIYKSKLTASDKPSKYNVYKQIFLD